MNDIDLRPIADADIDLLKTWLYKEYILKWYHDTDDWLHEIRERHDSFAWIRHFIVMVDETPIGFCQYYDCYDANHLELWYDVTEKGNTFSIDYLIGAEAYLGKGYGKMIVKLLIETIRVHENAHRIIVQPEKENHSSNGVLLANGSIFDNKLDYYYKLLD